MFHVQSPSVALATTTEPGVALRKYLLAESEDCFQGKSELSIPTARKASNEREVSYLDQRMGRYYKTASCLHPANENWFPQTMYL
ncbi:hypothetical protein Y1Q_0022764 [Alligator mississippiensis]|uniref:Uncharacterized protein n=1 Tax=Alligator mississippiensis TaxID=8496 RepID=A0A151N4A1_ALLMI|nr:hypothetical protein Y1Q_0022764 [Alligator mississippiensis]